SAQQPKISLIRLPIFKPARPCPLPIFCPYLFRRINVVYIQSAIIIKSANNALPAKFFNERDFSFPVAGVLVYFVTILVPVIFSALAGTEPYAAFLPALL